jgi:uncharacterized protein YeaO (DUF488 family)
MKRPPQKTAREFSLIASGQEAFRRKMRRCLGMKEIAPSTELRKWYGHDPDRWNEILA